MEKVTVTPPVISTKPPPETVGGAWRNLTLFIALLIDFSSSGQTALYASHVTIACNFAPLSLLFAQKPRFCASVKDVIIFRGTFGRNDR